MKVYHDPELAAWGEPPEPVRYSGRVAGAPVPDRLVTAPASGEWEEANAVGIMLVWPGCYRVVGASGDVFAEATTAADLLSWIEQFLHALDELEGVAPKSVVEEGC
ncbi:hypothetical protein A5633_23020 [Mycolicibacterium elephantis]|uniref:hypothetical protein n=1 Tax=Mycolicibacterium elephantis TaxID=81858 RepID=UPI0007EB67F2|nr:hypothetical protein [Mycolicibacterium elephantis]OBA71679.1 hypothetical protein A5633_23020 [Mycolicibacterium elephantis]